MKISKSREIIIFGDLNSRVGGELMTLINSFGEINTNNNCERLIEMCLQHVLRITDTSSIRK